MTIIAPAIATLPDDLLERCRSRGRGGRPHQHLLPRGPGRAPRHRLPRRARARAPRRLGARPRPSWPPSSAAWPATRRPPRWPRRCTSTGWASPASSSASATTRVVWMLRGGRRGQDLRRRPRRARQRRPGRDVDDARPSACEGGYRFTGRKMFGSNGPVWDYLGVHGLEMHGRTRPADRARLRRARHAGCRGRRDLGHARHAAVAEPRHAPRRGVRPGRPHRRGSCRPVPRRTCSCSAMNIWALPAHRQRVPRHRRPRPRAGGRSRPRTQDVGGHPAGPLRRQPVRAAPGRRDVPRARRGAVRR